MWGVKKPPQERLEATRDAAVALLEDVQHLRTVLGRQEPSRGEVRRISSVMRRLLVEQDLLRVAAPRVGRVLIDAPDNDPWYALAERYAYFFFISGGFTAYGTSHRALQAIHVPAGVAEPEHRNFDVEKRVPVSLDRFLSQRVLCWYGEWVSRSDVIKYVANVAHGVHSGEAKKPSELLLEEMSRCGSLSPEKLTVTVALKPQYRPTCHRDPLRYGRDSIAPVLLELLAATEYFAGSDDLAELEAVITAEVEQSGGFRMRR